MRISLFSIIFSLLVNAALSTDLNRHVVSAAVKFYEKLRFLVKQLHVLVS